MSRTMLSFASDYMEGAHPAILRRLTEMNLDKTPGYGLDPVCASAKARIREACAAPGAAVTLLVGGTQTNATVIDGMLRSWEGVIAAGTGHIAVHEAGAIEFGGHKVLTVPGADGKVTAAAVNALLDTYDGDDNREHTVKPGMVYISQPTEFGTLYSLSELEALSAVCREGGVPLYADGARLAYALGAESNDVRLEDLARLCDAFYIGGTKCGALLGEAVVARDPGRLPHFFTVVKQHGALLAKGWLLGVQFDELFRDGLYLTIGRRAVAQADRIRAALDRAGYVQPFRAPTNQVFVTLPLERRTALAGRLGYSFWEQDGPDRFTIRLATSWATADEDADALVRMIEAKEL